MFNFSYFSAFFATWVAYIGVFMPIFSFIITFVTNRVAIIVKGVVAYIASFPFAFFASSIRTTLTKGANPRPWMT